MRENGAEVAHHGALSRKKLTNNTMTAASDIRRPRYSEVP